MGQHTFHPSVLREYDIRGVVGATLNERDAYGLGRTFGSLAQDEGVSRIAVGRDGRTHSRILEEELNRGLIDSGVDVLRVGLGPTPMLYFATYELGVGGGIQITGSHNPANYNGFKMMLSGRSVFGSEIVGLGARAAAGNWRSGQGRVTQSDNTTDRYVDRLVRDFQGPALRIGWDAGNGATGPALEKLVKRLPGEHHTLFTEVNGEFPNHDPDPTVEKNLEHLKALVAEKNLDLGIAFDGDGDRVGVIDSRGNVIQADQLLAILAVPVLRRQPGATIVTDVKADRKFFERVVGLGGRPIMSRSGRAVRAKMLELRSPLAGELSGHIYHGNFYSLDDALFSATQLIEAWGASTGGQPAGDRSRDWITQPELRIKVDDGLQSTATSLLLTLLLTEGASVSTLDGVRVELAEGWWVVRPSVTEKKLSIRFGASTETDRETVKQHLCGKLDSIGLDIRPHITDACH